jgi:hypothetical protein
MKGRLGLRIEPRRSHNFSMRREKPIAQPKRTRKIGGRKRRSPDLVFWHTTSESARKSMQTTPFGGRGRTSMIRRRLVVWHNKVQATRSARCGPCSPAALHAAARRTSEYLSDTSKPSPKTSRTVFDAQKLPPQKESQRRGSQDLQAPGKPKSQRILIHHPSSLQTSQKRQETVT